MSEESELFASMVVSAMALLLIYFRPTDAFLIMASVLGVDVWSYLKAVYYE